MMSEHNLIENGSFKDASVTSWQRAHRNPKPLVFHDYTLEKKLVLLEPGEVLEQSIDAERIGHYRSFLIKATARTSGCMNATCIGFPELAPVTMQELEPAPDVNGLTALLEVSLTLEFATGHVSKTLFARAHYGMQPFEAEVAFEHLPETLLSAGIRCRTLAPALREQDRKYLWVTGFKLIPLY